MPFKKIGLAILCLVALTLASGLLAYAVGGAVSQIFTPITAVLLAVSLIALALPPLLGVVEVVASKNDNRYKILWGAAMLILGGLGMVLYFFMARKEMKE
jgi:drug/metabolite transporter (DMT)-like permease